MVSRTFNSEDIDLGLVGYWKLNDLRVSTSTAIDSSRGINNGTITGAVEATGVDGKRASAMSFDGTDDWVNSGNINTIRPTTAGTISAWVNINSSSPTTVGRILQLGVSQAGNKGFHIRQNGSSTSIQGFVGDGTTSLTPTMTVTRNKWIYLVHTFDGINSKLYLDAVLKNTKSFASTSSINYNDSNAFIGVFNTNPASPFKGNISNVRIYNRDITQGQVSKLFHQKL